MPSLLRMLVLAAALLVMPLQGIAETVSALLCHGDINSHAMHGHGAGDRTMHGDSQPDGGGTGGDPAYHPCCHNIGSAAPIAAPLVAQPEFPVRAFAPHPLHDLFVPEQPQRPPLA